MDDPEKIYLQPECCADSETGRLWCEHDVPEECPDGKPWTGYIRLDTYIDIFTQNALREAVLKEIVHSLTWSEWWGLPEGVRKLIDDEGNLIGIRKKRNGVKK